MDTRPKLKIALTPLDKTIEALGWVLLIMLWVGAVSAFMNMPEVIPTHFNAAGDADRFGSKDTIYILPIIGTVVFIALTILNRFPQIFNYPKQITSENALRQYTIATRLIRYLKSILLIVFIFLVQLTAQAATKTSIGIGAWFLPCMVAVIVIPIVISAVKMLRSK